MAGILSNDAYDGRVTEFQLFIIIISSIIIYYLLCIIASCRSTQQNKQTNSVNKNYKNYMVDSRAINSVISELVQDDKV